MTPKAFLTRVNGISEDASAWANSALLEPAAQAEAAALLAATEPQSPRSCLLVLGMGGESAERALAEGLASWIERS